MNSPTSMAEALASPEASFAIQLLRAGERIEARTALDCPADEWEPREPTVPGAARAPTALPTVEPSPPRAPLPERRPAVREPHPDALLDYNDLAALLNVPKGTLYNLVWQDKVPHVRLGPKTVRFEREAIDAWLTKRRSGR